MTVNYLSTPWLLLGAFADATRPLTQRDLRGALHGREIVGAMRELERAGHVVYKFDPLREARVYSITQAGLDRIAVIEAVVEVMMQNGRVPLSKLVEITRHDATSIRRIIEREARLRETDPNVWEVRRVGGGRPRLG